jgi:hypothetical protein
MVKNPPNPPAAAGSNTSAVVAALATALPKIKTLPSAREVAAEKIRGEFNAGAGSTGTGDDVASIISDAV